MDIYYCDKCGRRLTEADAPAGGAQGNEPPERRCKACAAELPATKKITVQTERAKPAALPRRTTSMLPAAPAGRAGGHPRPSARAPDEGGGSGNRNIFLGVGAFVVLASLAGLVYLLSASSGRTEAKSTSERPRATPTKPTAPQPAAGGQRPESRNDVRPAPASETRPKEDLAREAFAALEKPADLAPDDRTGRIRRIEAFLADYGDTIVASRARVMLNELKAPPPPAPPVAVEKPAPNPTPPAPQPTESPATPAPQSTPDEPAADGYQPFRVCRFDKDAERWEGDYGGSMDRGTFEGQTCVRARPSSRGCWFAVKGAYDSNGMRFRFHYLLRGGNELVVRFCNAGQRKETHIKGIAQGQWAWGVVSPADAGFQGQGAHIEVGAQTTGGDAFLLVDNAVYERK